MNSSGDFLKFLYDTFVTPTFGYIFRPNHPSEELAAVVVGVGRPGDAGDHAHVAIDMPDTQPSGPPSVTYAASSESATAQPAHLPPRRVQPQPADTGGKNRDIRLRKWIYFMVGTYLTTIDVSLQAIQTLKNAPELLHSSQFHYFRMFLVISLLYLTISAFVRPFSVSTALVLEIVAALFGFLAFILVITIADIPREVVQVASATFTGSLFAVLLSTYLWRRWGHGTRFSR